MRNVKIVCTIGPASASQQVIDRMVRAGMNVARLNFSHGSHEDHAKIFRSVRRASDKYHAPVAVLQDIRGLKIRVGTIKNGAVHIRKGDHLTLTTKRIPGDHRRISVSWPNLVRDVEPGAKILLDDGLLQLKVVKKTGHDMETRVVEGGILRERKGVNLPGTTITGSVFTKKDRQDLMLGISLGVDYVALSFVRSRDDIIRVKRWMMQHNADIPVIAKIENRQALENIVGIIESADGLMVARGDLGVEMPPERVPLIQKDLIHKCNTAMKPVITATQMLESMTEHMSPTRAEAADVANAVLDGTDALMLSAETSIGKYPVHALNMMDRIIRVTEGSENRVHTVPLQSENFAQALAEAACSSASDIKSRTIVAFSRSGFTALLVSKYRPMVPVTGFTISEETRRRMNLYWGVSPYVMNYPNNTDEMILETEKELRKQRLVKKGDAIVIVASSPFPMGGKTNIMKLHKVGY